MASFANSSSRMENSLASTRKVHVFNKRGRILVLNRMGRILVFSQMGMSLTLMTFDSVIFTGFRIT